MSRIDLPEIRICGIYNLDQLLRDFQPDYVISISDTDDSSVQAVQRAMEGFAGKATRLQFEDIDRLMDRFTAPSLRHARQVREDLDTIMVDGMPRRILAHCAMGLSRSPAMLMCALTHVAVRHGEIEDPASVANQIFTLTKNASPQMMPNKRIMEIGASMERTVGEKLRRLNIDHIDELKQRPAEFSW